MPLSLLRLRTGPAAVIDIESQTQGQAIPKKRARGLGLVPFQEGARCPRALDSEVPEARRQVPDSQKVPEARLQVPDSQEVPDSQPRNTQFLSSDSFQNMFQDSNLDMISKLSGKDMDKQLLKIREQFGVKGRQAFA